MSQLKRKIYETVYDEAALEALIAAGKKVAHLFMDRLEKGNQDVKSFVSLLQDIARDRFPPKRDCDSKDGAFMDCLNSFVIQLIMLETNIQSQMKPMKLTSSNPELKEFQSKMDIFRRKIADAIPDIRKIPEEEIPPGSITELKNFADPKKVREL